MRRRGRARTARARRKVAERASGRSRAAADAWALVRAARAVGEGAKLPRSEPRDAAESGGAPGARRFIRALGADRRGEPAFSLGRRPRLDAHGFGLNAPRPAREMQR